MIDTRVFTVKSKEGQDAEATGASLAREIANLRVKEGHTGVRIVNRFGEQFRWWPDLGR